MQHNPSTGVHSFNSSVWKVEAEESEVQGHPHIKFKASWTTRDPVSVRAREKENNHTSLGLEQRPLWRPSGLAAVRCPWEPGLALYLRTERYRGDDLEADPSKAGVEALWNHLHWGPCL